MNENELSHEIIAAAIDVHRSLGGPGLLEDMYEEALAVELEQRGFSVRTIADLPSPNGKAARPGHQLWRNTREGRNSPSRR